MIRLLICTCISYVLLSCNSSDTQVKKESKETVVKNNLDSLKRVAQPGDLILRTGDDMLSEQIKYLNTKDPSYSHAGMIVEKNGQKMVGHIYPHESPADTIQYIAIDSFANPATNLRCALYRYNLSAAERDSLMRTINFFKANGVHFDKHYDLSTDKQMYCSEMIAKALNKATNGRIHCKEDKVPKRMRPLIAAYFKKLGFTPKLIDERKFISLDNLYILPECQLVMKFPLKYFPGQ
ncbi:MAG: hypothetical protein C4329_07200 [Chitinophagaceae bacterium]